MNRQLRSCWPALMIFVCGASLAEEDRFTEELIAEGFGYAFAVAAADLDGDGDADLTSCDTDKGDFYWFQNDGQGHFRRHHIRLNEPGWFERHAIGDINGDGRPDIAVVKNLDGHLVWFEHGGSPEVSDNWQRHVISTDIRRAYDVVLVDLNGDGRLDAAASAWNGNHFAWFENPGSTAPDREWTKRLIDDNVSQSRNIRVGDFNGDGRPDLLCTGHGVPLTAWYEQPSDPAARTWIRHIVDDSSPGPTHGHPMDLDGDGDQDILLALGFNTALGTTASHQVVWYENDGVPGQGSVWRKHLIGPLNNAFEAFAADLDGDGDPDVAATAWGDPGQVVWFKNPGDPRQTWTKHVLKDVWRRANQVIIFDADGDSRPDIAATAERGTNELRLWRNRK